MDGQARLAAIFLLCAPGLLAEVGSQNIPLFTYLQPATFLLGSLAYGVPVLLIRELAVARGLDIGGIAILGAAYGILNEGVLARTLTQASGAPLLDFAGYGQAGALQVGWAIFIVGWHALHSVVYPILIADWLFPGAAGRPWFGRTRALRYAMYVVLFALYAQHVINAGPDGPPVLGLYLAATAVLVVLALRRHGKERRASPVASHAATWGGLSVVLYLFAFWAPAHVPFAVFVVVMAATVGIAIWSMMRAGWRACPELLRFGLGDYLAFTSLATALAVAGGRNPIESVVAGTAFVVVFAWLLRAVSARVRATTGGVA